MATIKYAVQGGRREQMKRELIGLVIGTTLLMAGMAFLFSQTLVADSSSKEAAVTAAVVTPPAPVATADIPVIAALDVANNNATVTPVNAPAVAVVTPPEPAVTPAAVLPTPPTVETVAPVEATAPVEAPKVDASSSGPTGWIYAGQFANGKWSEKGLTIGAELPVAGNKYPLSWGATVREHPPGKRSEGGGKLGKTLGNLAAGHAVEIVQVKKSGSKGHVWLEIKYQ